MVEPTFRGGDVALFIDWENFKISLAAGNRTPNLSSLKEEISEHGRVVVAKAYADWVTRAPELRGASQFINDPPTLYAAGIEPVFVPTRIPSTQAASANGMRTYRVKNSVDVKMTADCIECAHSYPNIGTFVLVSGDSDFLHVVNALRTMGKRVVIVGVSWSTSRRLADQVDSLLLYDKDVDPLAPQPAVLPQHAPQREAQNDAPELAEAIRAIEEIIRDDRAAGGNPLLTSIKQRLMRRYPGFDEKKLGFSGFKKLMARAAEDGNIKLIHAGLVDWAIMADEETPESAIPESAIEDAPPAASAKSGRRRGGRRRHSGQRDADAAEETAETPADEDAEAVEPYAQPGPGLAESPEETAATDFEVPTAAQPEETAPEETAEEAGAEEPAAEAAGEAEETPEAADAPEPAAAEPQAPFASDAGLADAVRDALDSVSLPAEPEDGQHSERVSDLILMAHTLENREGADQVIYNSLVSEICGALEQGLAAGNAEIAQRWSIGGTRDYVSRTLRGLSEGDFFRRTTHSWREEGTGRRRQRSVFNLNRDHELVGRMLIARLGPAANDGPSAEPEAEPDEPQADAAQLKLVAGADAADDAPEAGPPPTSAEDDADAAGDTPEAGPPPASVEDDVDAAGNTPEAGPLPASVGDDAGAAGDTSEAGPLPASAEDDADAAEDTPAAGPPPAFVKDDADEEYDEPQPRNVRRRPFTSRLLRS